jgi:hypothetical protein
MLGSMTVTIVCTLRDVVNGVLANPFTKKRLFQSLYKLSQNNGFKQSDLKTEPNALSDLLLNILLNFKDIK